MKDKTLIRKKTLAILFIVMLALLLSGNFINYKVVGKTLISSYRENSSENKTVFNKAKNFIAATDAAVNQGTIGREEFVEIYGLAQKIMDKRIMADPMYGSLYKNDRDEIVFAVSDKYMDGYLGNMYEFANKMLEYEIPFLYVQLPFKLPPKAIENQLPATACDRANENADYFVKSLRQAKVNTYDLREDFWKLPMNRDKIFFDTDHHWTINAAFEATRLIEKYLNKNFNFEIDSKVWDIKNYNQKIYKKYFIGSMGRRVGRLYGGVDDFTLITPKFHTDIKLTEKDYGNTKEFKGTFDEAVLVKEYINNKDLTTNRYAVYHGDNQELIFENNLVNKGRVLIIKDSFGIPVYSFMSMGVHEVRALDLRLFNGDLATYAKEYKPDVVIIMYNADCFSDPMFDFKGELE